VLTRLTLLAFALILPATGQWKRVVLSGKGEFTDVPAPHPLRYFTAHPALRDDGGDLCAGCPGYGYSFRTAVRPVGTLAGYRIVDVLYYVSGHDPNGPFSFATGDQVKWKSILVEVAPDRYREIFHLQALFFTVALAPSRIVQSGDERVLAAEDSDGGNGGGCWEDYWWIDRDGPHTLDFSRLRAAIDSRLPKNTTYRSSCGNLDLANQRIESWVRKSNPACMACDFVGQVTARFALKGAIAEPVQIDYKAGDPQR